jgi:hypothetical protein
MSERGRPAVFGEPALARICIRVTYEQRTALEQVARENATDLSGVIREAVNSFVSDYREDSEVFRQPKFNKAS